MKRLAEALHVKALPMSTLDNVCFRGEKKGKVSVHYGYISFIKKKLLCTRMVYVTDSCRLIPGRRQIIKLAVEEKGP